MRQQLRGGWEFWAESSTGEEGIGLGVVLSSRFVAVLFWRWCAGIARRQSV